MWKLAWRVVIMLNKQTFWRSSPVLVLSLRKSEISKLKEKIRKKRGNYWKRVRNWRLSPNCPSQRTLLLSKERSLLLQFESMERITLNFQKFCQISRITKYGTEFTLLWRTLSKLLILKIQISSKSFKRKSTLLMSVRTASRNGIPKLLRIQIFACLADLILSKK